MTYRTFGRLNWSVSALGYGVMRMPLLRQSPTNVDVDQGTKLIHRAIEGGINYFDTAYTYHGGNSERLLGTALKDGLREQVRLATKLPVWNLHSRKDADRIFSEQLKRLQTDWVDVYLFHALNGESWKKVLDLDLISWAERQRERGRIRNLGFSFHGNVDAFRSIVDGHAGWDVCHIQYNYMDEHFQAGVTGLRYASARGLAVVVMEPLRGGALATLPAETQQLLKQAPVQRTPAEWSLQWIWSQPEVSLILSGMSTREQLDENLEAAGRSRVGLLTETDQTLLASVRDQLRGVGWIACTGCGYCLPCPEGVDIPGMFQLYNRTVPGASAENGRKAYQQFPEEGRAEHCTQCGACLPKCPQGLPIPDLLLRVRQTLGND